jgi:16S rRNA (uracil1498-N3)-methyltransferase
MRDGDPVEIFDSAGNAFAARLAVDNRLVRAHLERQVRVAEAPAFAFTLAQALPKGQKMDFIVEKTTELGVARIVPFASRRAVALAPGEAHVERWRRLAKAAAQQCGRPDVPAVEAPVAFEALLPQFADYDVVLVAWEAAETRPLRETLASQVARASRIMAIVGPEGGFAHDEADAAVAAGARPVSLGKRILRTETAGFVLLAALLYERGEL